MAAKSGASNGKELGRSNGFSVIERELSTCLLSVFREKLIVIKKPVSMNPTKPTLNLTKCDFGFISFQNSSK